MKTFYKTILFLLSTISIIVVIFNTQKFITNKTHLRQRFIYSESLKHMQEVFCKIQSYHWIFEGTNINDSVKQSLSAYLQMIKEKFHNNVSGI